MRSRRHVPNERVSTSSWATRPLALRHHERICGAVVRIETSVRNERSGVAEKRGKANELLGSVHEAVFGSDITSAPCIRQKLTQTHGNVVVVRRVRLVVTCATIAIATTIAIDTNTIVIATTTPLLRLLVLQRLYEAITIATTTIRCHYYDDCQLRLRRYCDEYCDYGDYCYDGDDDSTIIATTTTTIATMTTVATTTAPTTTTTTTATVRLLLLLLLRPDYCQYYYYDYCCYD